MPTSAQYPEGWYNFSQQIRFERAGGRCECEGECGLHQTNPGPRRCTEMNSRPAVFARGVVLLTVAHLCDCSPPCAIAEHVKAMCQRCHLRVDVELHVKHAASTRMRKKESAGQARMDFGE